MGDDGDGGSGVVMDSDDMVVMEEMNDEHRSRDCAETSSLLVDGMLFPLWSMFA